MSYLNLKPASKGLHPHHYSPITLGSLDYGELDPLLCLETVNTDKWTSVKAGGKLLLAPQVFPPYGKLFMKNATFFVPEHQLLECSSAFHRKQQYYKGKDVFIPKLHTVDINWIFSQDCEWAVANKLSVWVATTTNPLENSPADGTYDFSCLLEVEENHTAELAYYRLTQKGRRYFKILKGLGYDFVQYRGFGPGTAFNTIYSEADAFITALPLLAYCKIYVDYFLNGQFYNYNDITAMLQRIRDGQSYSQVIGGVSTPFYELSSFGGRTIGTLTASGIAYIVSHIFVPHEQNMYTEAWNSPNNPINDSYSTILDTVNPTNLISPYHFSASNNIENIDVNNSGVLYRNTVNGAPQAVTYVSNNGLNLLRAFRNWLTRGNVAGSKSVLQLFAELGAKSDDFNAHFAHKIAEGATQIDFNAVVSNADTDNGESGDAQKGKTLGAYAGFGASGVTIDFDYESKDFGFIITVGWLQVVPILMRGFDPKTLRVDALDYWTAEYDGKTVRAIPIMEISSSQSGKAKQSAKQVFGFTNIYNEYRNLRDNVFGDFLFGNLRNFIFARDYSKISDAQTLQPQSMAVQTYDHDDNPDMTDPFQMAASDGDRFYLYLSFDITAQRPMLPKSDTFDLGGTGDVQIPLNGVLES